MREWHGQLDCGAVMAYGEVCSNFSILMMDEKDPRRWHIATVRWFGISPTPLILLLYRNYDLDLHAQDRKKNLSFWSPNPQHFSLHGNA